MAIMHTRSSRRGFTLAEILIALGILGVGLTMTAMLFPVGIKQAEDSARASNGALLCEVGLNTARMMLVHLPPDDPDGPGVKVQWTDADGDAHESVSMTVPSDVLVDVSELFPDEKLLYDPTAAPGSDELNRRDKGFRILLRRMRPGENDYQIAVMSFDAVFDQSTDEYGPNATTSTVHVESFTPCEIELWHPYSAKYEAKEVDYADLKVGIYTGSILLVANNGYWCRVVESVAPTEADPNPDTWFHHDRIISQEGVEDPADATFISMHERRDSTGQKLPQTPGLAVMSMRTSLRSE